MSEPRERKKGTGAEPAAGPRPKGGRPATSASGEAGGPGFLEQLRQRLAQAPAAPESPSERPAKSLEELDGAESEGIDLVPQTGAHAEHPDQDDDDFEPTVLLQSPDLMNQVRNSLRDEAEAVAVEPAADEPDTPQYWSETEEDTVSQTASETDGSGLSPEELDGATLEPLTRADVESLTGEFEELLEESFSSGEGDSGEDEMTMAEAPPAVFADAPELDTQDSIDEDGASGVELEEQTMVGGEELLQSMPPSRPIHPAKAMAPVASMSPAELDEVPPEAPFEERMELALAGDSGEGNEGPSDWAAETAAGTAVEDLETDEDTDPDAMPFEARLEEALAEVADVEPVPVEALEMSPVSVEDQEQSFEERLEAHLFGGTGSDLGAMAMADDIVDLNCTNCGQPVAGLIAQRLLELSSSVESLRAELRALGERLGS